MLNFPSDPRYMPCPDCGASVPQVEREAHVCEEERWVTFQLFQLREEVEAFEAGLARYLDSPAGRFEAWYAQRRRGSA